MVRPQYKLTHFSKFPKLPLELRLMCWEATLAYADAQIVMVKLGVVEKEGAVVTQLHAAYNIPPLLGVSKESRDIVLAAYHRFVDAPLMGRPVYINLSKDALVFQNDEALAIFLDLPKDAEGRFTMASTGTSLPKGIQTIGLIDIEWDQYFPTLIRGDPRVLKRLGQPERISILRKRGKAGYRQRFLVWQIAQKWHEVDRSAESPYEGPLVEANTFKSLRSKLNAPDNLELARIREAKRAVAHSNPW
ncbi:uncharacterized protein RAG0_10862 [Rhynchosporium agropyri]|uniref:2EXR domain-containing protein n=1 Tax=Rhynchosporium agropyri TaxID=914238 RepID=A0A1E1L1H7_9HELO|nr:uncharacterized protein RAG0_10862 [Rhynchosporium agropyri]